MSELEKRYNELYFTDELIKKSEKLPNKIKICLEKGKGVNFNNEKQLHSLINQCLNIENNIKDITEINDKIIKKKQFSQNIICFSHGNDNKLSNYIKIKEFGQIIFRQNKIQNYTLKKTINLNDGICSIIILSNNDIAIGKRNDELIIFDSMDFKEITKVQAHSGGNTSIYSLLELRDKSIITCGGNKTMKNFKYIINDKKLVQIQELYCRDNSSYICRAVELPDKTMVSSDNSHILVWKKCEKDKFEIMKDISDFGGVMQHLILINDKYIACHNNSGVMRIYNALDNYKLEKEISNLISYAYMHRFCIINKDIFCLSGDQFIYLFSISKMELIKSINVNNMKFHSILLLPNQTILCGANGNLFSQFEINDNYEIKEISKKESVHSSIIWQLVNNNIKENSDEIISVSDDGTLKIWNIDYFIV